MRRHRETKQSRYNENGEILCTYCLKYKSKENYFPANLRNRHYKCIECVYVYRNKNINHLISKIYGHQKAKDKVCYTWDEFAIWLANHTRFIELFKVWVALNFDKTLTPAVMRIDCEEPYSLDNLKVTTASVGRQTCSRKRERCVIQLDKNKTEIARYPNARVAAQILDYKNYSNIHAACKGSKKTAAGFKWRYK